MTAVCRMCKDCEDGLASTGGVSNFLPLIYDPFY